MMHFNPIQDWPIQDWPIQDCSWMGVQIPKIKHIYPTIINVLTINVLTQK